MHWGCPQQWRSTRLFTSFMFSDIQKFIISVTLAHACSVHHINKNQMSITDQAVISVLPKEMGVICHLRSIAGKLDTSGNNRHKINGHNPPSNYELHTYLFQRKKGNK